MARGGTGLSAGRVRGADTFDDEDEEEEGEEDEEDEAGQEEDDEDEEEGLGESGARSNGHSESLATTCANRDTNSSVCWGSTNDRHANRTLPPSLVMLGTQSDEVWRKR
jgi:hypothetical protein